MCFLFLQLQKFKKDRVSNHKMEDETDEIKKIKKVRFHISTFSFWTFVSNRA